MAVTTSLRYRINVSQTSTGKKSWDATVEQEGADLDSILRLSDELTAELTNRYPPMKAEEK